MLPYLIAGAIGFVVGKLLEEDEAPKYADGGVVDTDIPRFLYHTTPSNNFQNIKKNGLSVGFDNKIYFTKNLGSSINIANQLYQEYNKNEDIKFYHIWRIDTKKLNNPIFFKDEDYNAGIYITEPIPKNAIKQYESVKVKYADGGSVLLAPNGNPSYLTPEQYKLVRTPEFKAWFGDWEKAYETGNYDNVSKVIGYNMKGFSGEPLICSHSSYDKFNQFKTPTFFQEGGGGGAYGDSSDEDYVNYNVFLNIKNLLELRGAFLKDKFTPLISEIYKNAGLDDDEYKNRMEFAEEYRDGYGLFKLFEKPYWKNEYGYNWEWVFDYCKKNGYDGFVMRDSDQSMQYYITTWVALYPEQIKLADGTNTTFDANNPDIRYNGGGEIEELKFSNKIESDAMGYDIGDYLYHITPVSNFNTIIKKGFIPKNGISINNKPFENRLYFATSLISAYDLSVNFGSYRDDSEYVIFKIKSDCINDYEEDDLFAHGIYVDYKVSNKCIVGYVDANDLFNKFDDEDIENLYY